MRKLIIILLFIIVGTQNLVSVRAQNLVSVRAQNLVPLHADEINELSNFKYGLYPDKVRIVFEFKNDAPDYEIYLNENQKEIIVDLFNTKFPDDFKPEQLKYDFLLCGIDYNLVNSNQVQFKINLKYKMVQTNIKKMVLVNPHRLVIDIFRQYTILNELKVTKNISLTQKLIIGKKDKLLINELFIDKNSEDVSLKVVLANNNTESREKLSDIARQYGALIAINGGYFDKKSGPLGLIIIDGKILSEDVKKRPPRTTFGITTEKKFVFDRVFACDGKISTKDGTNWDNVAYAIGAGPRLVKEGKLYITACEEELAENGNNITKKAGRSAIAVTSDDKLILMTVSGYTSNEAQGVGLYSLAHRLKKLGAIEAMNLDGGGSAAIYVQDQIISAPPEAQNNSAGHYFERKIADALLIFDSSENLMPYEIKLEVKPSEIIADGKSTIGVNAFVYTRDGKNVPDGTIVFFITDCGDISFSAKTFNGLAAAYLKVGRKSGYSKITAKCGFIEKSIEVLFK